MSFDRLRRRTFITLLASAATWPLAARAQQGERVRRIGVLTGGAENDPANQAAIAALRDGLAKLAWAEGRNLRIELRFGGGDADRFRAYAAELVSLAPEVIVTSGGAAARAMEQQTQTVPVIFTGAGSSIDAGLVKNLAHPEGNVTGIANLFSSIGGKWLELLKEAAPRVERVAVIYNPQLLLNDNGYISSIEEAARVLAVKAIKVPYSDAVDLVRAIDAFAAQPNGGLIVLPPAPTPANSGTTLRLAAQHRLPTIYPNRSQAAEGGLMAYGSNPVDRLRRAASFVDRILRGAKVSELPVEFPTKFELAINLKTAKAIGLTIPEAFLLRADELIE
jgi:putative ABC transport system substrate-binding protein